MADISAPSINTRSSLLKSPKANMVKSDKNYDVSCKSRMACLFICHVVKQCRCDDNSLGDKTPSRATGFTR